MDQAETVRGYINRLGSWQRHANARLGNAPLHKQILYTLPLLPFILAFLVLFLALGPIVILVIGIFIWIHRAAKTLTSSYREILIALRLLCVFFFATAIWSAALLILFAGMFIAVSYSPPLQIIMLFLCVGLVWIFIIAYGSIKRELKDRQALMRMSTELEGFSEGIVAELDADGKDVRRGTASARRHRWFHRLVSPNLWVAASAVFLPTACGMFFILTWTLSRLYPEAFFTSPLAIPVLARDHALNESQIAMLGTAMSNWITFTVEESLRGFPGISPFVKHLSQIEPIYPWGQVVLALSQPLMLGALLGTSLIGYAAFKLACGVAKSPHDESKSNSESPAEGPLPPRPDPVIDFANLKTREAKVATRVRDMAKTVLATAGYPVVEAENETGEPEFGVQIGARRITFYPIVLYRKFDFRAAMEFLQASTGQRSDSCIFLVTGSADQEALKALINYYPKVRIVPVGYDQFEAAGPDLIKAVKELATTIDGVEAE